MHGEGPLGRCMRTIVGLRNPGREYEATRHNVGAQAVTALAESHQASWRRRPMRSRSETAEVRIGGERVLLSLPLRMMNVSGGPVSYVMKYHRVALGELLVVHDDIDLPFGRLRVRSGGSAGGHNGVKSVAKALGNPGFLATQDRGGPPSVSYGPRRLRFEEVPVRRARRHRASCGCRGRSSRTMGERPPGRPPVSWGVETQ